MIGNVTRGTRVAGLVAYLMGPGKSDQHSDQHVIAASDEVNVPDAYLSATGARKALNEQLTHYYDLYRPEYARGEVYHFSLSNLAEDRRLSDREWADVARGAVAELGFDDPAGQAPTRWVAVRHGLSRTGNDHIHVAVVLARSDGTKAYEPNGDFFVLDKFAVRMEHRYALINDRTPARVAAGGVPQASRADQEISARAGEAVPLRIRLQREVRAAAAAADSEAEFITNLRAAGLHAQPRYAPGGRSEVTGYKVAALRERDTDGTLIYFGGGRLARDLTLPALRAGWQDTAQDRAAALKAWGGSTTGRPAAVVPSPRAAEDAAAQLLTAARELTPADVDAGEWSDLARSTAGVLAAAASEKAGPIAAELDQASRQLARASLVNAGPARRSRGPEPIAPHALAGLLLARHRSLLSAATLMQISLTVQALSGLADARFDARLAEADLARVRARAAGRGDTTVAVPAASGMAPAASIATRTAAAGAGAGRSTQMSSSSPEEQAGEALRPLALGAATAVSIAVRAAQPSAAQEAELTRSQERAERDAQREQQQAERDARHELEKAQREQQQAQRDAQRELEKAQREQQQAIRDLQRAEVDGRRVYHTVSRDRHWLDEASMADMDHAVHTLSSGPSGDPYGPGGNPVDWVAAERIHAAAHERFGPAWQERTGAPPVPSPADAGTGAEAGTTAARTAAVSSRATPRAAAGAAGPVDPHDAVRAAAQRYGVLPRDAPSPTPPGGSDGGSSTATPPSTPGAGGPAGSRSRTGYGARRVQGRSASSPLLPPAMRRGRGPRTRGTENERD